jgi:DNA primase
MLIEKSLITEAKKRLGREGALIIAKDLELKDFNEKDLKACCHWHNEETPSLIWNEKSDSWFCFGCGVSKDIINHYIDFYGLTYIEAVEKLFKQVGMDTNFAEKGVKTKREYKYPNRIEVEDRSKVEEWFLQERHISKETLDYCDVQQSNRGFVVFHVYDTNDVLNTVKLRNMHPKRGEAKEFFLPGFDSSHLLFNMNKCIPTQPLVITEGQIDAMSIIEAGYKNVVSVMGGCENLKWIEECFDWLQQFDKIVIWSDNDAPGIKMRKEVVARIGTWKCKFVNLPKEIANSEGEFVPVKDANDVLVKCGVKQILSYIDNAEDTPVPNVLNLADAEDFDLETAEGLYTGIKNLDKILYKLVFGNVVVLTGKRASGKSSLLNQIFVAEALQQGHDIFLFSGELAPQLVKNWCELQIAGPKYITVKDIHVKKIDPAARKEIRKWYDGRIFVYDNPTDNSAETILARAEDVVRRYGTKIIILDNLLTIDLGENENNQWQKQKQFMVKLINFAASMNVLIVLVVHPHKTSDIRITSLDTVGGSSAIVNLAQYALGVHRYTDTEKQGETDKKGNWLKGKEPIEYDAYCEVMKSRLTGIQGKCDLYFNPRSYRFWNRVEELWKRYSWDKSTDTLPKDTLREENIPSFMRD